MATRRFGKAVCWTLVGLITVVTGRVEAAEVADLRVNADFAEWTPQVEADALDLRIARPDGRVIERQFPGGLRPSVAFAGGGLWPDGIYIWELVLRSGSGVRTESGAFWIMGGNGVPNGYRDGENLGMSRVAEPSLRSAGAPDQQIGDDLIVTGDACIGAACANGELFGVDDVLWLKAERVRLKFDDTSTDVGLPANDWQLTANDPSSGGMNKFTIEDLTGSKKPFTILAGAPNDSLFVAADGKVGLGASTPAAEMEVRRNTGALANMLRLTNNGGVQFLLDRTDSPGGFLAKDWQFSNFNATFEISVPGSSPAQFSQNANGNLQISGTLTQLSDRGSKSAIRSVDADAVLEKLLHMPVTEWSYAASPEDRHMGPMAQDFRAAFGLGSGDTGIAAIDADGVNVVALQALFERMRRETGELRARLARLEAVGAGARRELPTGKQGRVSP